MLSPHDMILTPDGAYLVATDMGQDRVLLLDPQQLTLQGIIGEGELSLPHDVAFDRQGRLLVADTGNDRIAIYERDGSGIRAKLVDSWDNLDGPEGIAVGPEGEVYIAVTLENRIICIRDGKIEASTTSALGLELEQPHDIELSKTSGDLTLIVTDPGNDRLLVLNKDLSVRAKIPDFTPPLSEPKYISLDTQGRLFIADQFNNAVRVLDQNQTPIATFAYQHLKLPEGILAVENNVWVSDSDGGRILLYHLQDRP